jgi:hypothetical protein
MKGSIKMSNQVMANREPLMIEKITWRIRNLFKKIRGDYRPEKSNMYLWAKSELDRLIVGCEEREGKDGLETQLAITKDILDIVKVFCTQGHSGTSASYTLSMITRLLDWKPITPLTGENDEWGPVKPYNLENNTQQNKRCSAVFRDNFDNSTAHYIYGKVYSDNGGHSWFTGNHKDGVVQSFTPITFPYHVPDKPEYIYLNGEDSEEIITDEARIKELYDAWEEKYKNM